MEIGTKRGSNASSVLAVGEHRETQAEREGENWRWRAGRPKTPFLVSTALCPCGLLICRATSYRRHFGVRKMGTQSEPSPAVVTCAECRVLLAWCPACVGGCTFSPFLILGTQEAVTVQLARPARARHLFFLWYLTAGQKTLILELF